jgi:23S rRNA pseudouridine955/2504/2580 synthase
MKSLPAHVLTAGADDDGRRLDRVLRRAFPDMPLSGIHRLLRKGRVRVDGVRAGGDCRVREGARIQVLKEPGRPPEEAAPGGGGRPGSEAAEEAGSLGAARAGPPDLDILWEGAGLLALNKPVGLAAHGENSLDTRVQAYLRDKRRPSLSFRPGPLHRLDKPTSGIILFSLNLEGARGFSLLLRERRLRKTYLALAEGEILRPETWEEALVRDHRRELTLPVPEDEPGAKSARTRVVPLVANPAYSLIRLEIDTGRTHQIRAQAAFHRHPLGGDRKYGGKPLPGGLLLHAYALEFPGGPLPLPPEGAALGGKTLIAPVPAAFWERISAIFGEKIVKTLNIFHTKS